MTADKRKRLLIIDDDDVCCLINRKIAEFSGSFSEINVVTDAGKGIDLLKKGHNGGIGAPDLILLDINMPGMNGFEFIHAFQHLEIEDKDRVTIVILSSSNDLYERQKAADLGISRYIVKPLTPQGLRSIMMEQ